MIERYLPEIILSAAGVAVTIALALRRVFVMRNECQVYRRTCEKLHDKEEELKRKDFEMRDENFARLEAHFSDFREEVRQGFKSTADEICSIKKMLRIVLSKMNIDIDEAMEK